MIVLFIVFALLTIRAEVNLVRQSAKIAMSERLQQNITAIVQPDEHLEFQQALEQL
ncbi:hypothetical protein [Rappaport israeli]|uniref:hypothetical protein n=1 Tax=Rappaport israeli TaxID=1839807 RepID=UPI000A82C65D|nr:hypothetical protein [Rappaport israeli]